MMSALLSSLVVQILLGTAALLMTTTGLAAADALPDAVQEWVSDAAARVGIDLPNPSDTSADTRQEPELPANPASTSADPTNVDSEGDPADGSDDGSDVADSATGGDPAVNTTLPEDPPTATTVPIDPPVTTTVPIDPSVSTTLPPEPPVTTTAPIDPPVTTTVPPEPPVDNDPDIWTCQERVDNGAVWIPGKWNGSTYLSETSVDVDVPLCIDIREEHWLVTEWTVSWEGTASKDPKGLKFVFEEGVHQSVYAETEWTSSEGTVTSGTVPMVLNFAGDDVTHLVFVAMPFQGDNWTDISFTVTPKT